MGEDQAALFRSRSLLGRRSLGGRALLRLLLRLSLFRVHIMEFHSDLLPPRQNTMRVFPRWPGMPNPLDQVLNLTPAALRLSRLADFFDSLTVKYLLYLA